MSFWRQVAATVVFEFQRSLTISRLSIFVVLALFPPAIVAINARLDGLEVAPVIVGVTVMMSGILAELLWATPIVYAELEGKTWVFLAVRPRGIAAVVIGKYLIAAAWTAAVCTVALTISAAVAELAGVPDVPRLWAVFMVLVLLASLAYAAVFALIGVLFHRRAMVFAMVYVILLEVVVAQIPAIVNQITVRHHLTSLGVKWLDFRYIGDERLEDFILVQMLGAGEADWLNFTAVAAMTAVALGATLWAVTNREYITADEV